MKKKLGLALVLVLLFTIFKSSIFVKAQTNKIPPDFIRSFDTMTESMNTSGPDQQLTSSQIDADIALFTKYHVNYITNDVFWDWPDYMQRWTDSIRKGGVHVWYRIHPAGWEGNYGLPANITPSEYLTKEHDFILAHPTLWKSGDILDFNPEPENSPY